METDCVMMFVIAGTANSSSYGSRSEFWGPVRYLVSCWGMFQLLIMCYM